MVAKTVMQKMERKPDSTWHPQSPPINLQITESGTAKHSPPDVIPKEVYSITDAAFLRKKFEPESNQASSSKKLNSLRKRSELLPLQLTSRISLTFRPSSENHYGI